MKQKALSAAVADPLRSSPRDSPAVSLSGKASPIRHPRDCPGGAQGRRPPTTPGRLPPGHGGLLSPSPFSLSSFLRVRRSQRNTVPPVTISGVWGPDSSGGLGLVAGVAAVRSSRCGPGFSFSTCRLGCVLLACVSEAL